MITGPLPHAGWRIPLAGDMLPINPKQTVQTLSKVVTELGGVCAVDSFGYRTVIFSNAQLIKEINDEAHFEKHVGQFSNNLRPLGGDGLFTVDHKDPKWRRAHDVLSPAFHKDALIKYHAAILAAVQELAGILGRAAAAEEWVDISQLLRRLTIEIIGRVGFGCSFGRLTDDVKFISVLLAELKYSSRMTSGFPWFENAFTPRRVAQHKANIDYLRDTAQEIIDDRRSKEEEQGRGAGGDLLSALLWSGDGRQETSLSDEDIKDQMLTFLIAGSQTSASALAFCFHYLSQNPKILEKAQQEIATLKAGGEPGRWPQFSELGKLRYLRCIIDESLRLWPPLPVYLRQAKHDMAIGNGRFKFCENDWGLVLVLAAHRDEETWGRDAAKFCPERFSLKNNGQSPDRIFRPFGTGARSCIGRQLAYQEMLTTLAVILERFDLESDPRYNLRVSERLALRPDGLRLKFSSRLADGSADRVC
ncbi:cytochrome P450 [Mycobacterium sp.]|uniref:cytochrome P450 n=1 Tax=Mycobacterium sp. TaxID=1785 RepID=UPI003BADA1C6